MKKLIAVFLIIVMCFTMMSFTVTAEKPNISTITNYEYGFKIQEYTDDFYRNIRSYSADDNFDTISEMVTLNTVDSVPYNDAYIETKAILLALGMSEDVVSKLSVETLSNYSVAESIISTIVYVKTDVDGNTTNISEKEALEVVNSLTVNDIESATMKATSVASVEENFSDNYMKISLFTTYLGGESYHFSADAEWLTMPTWRSADSFGICMNGHTVVRNSCLGWISYNKVPYSIFGTEIIPMTEDWDKSTFIIPVNNTYSGAAIAFGMKNDWVFGDSYTNYKVHVEFNTVITNPDQALNFNVVATYHHTQKSVDIDGVSVGIDSSGSDRKSTRLNSSHII